VAPAALILHTYRLCAHSKGDDPRDDAELAACWEHDPLAVHGARLPAAARAQAEAACAELVDRAFAQAVADPMPASSSLTPPLDHAR
jgi:TPP-dependent pyruvate/acetoin dehydrogenase alpha subunit